MRKSNTFSSFCTKFALYIYVLNYELVKQILSKPKEQKHFLKICNTKIKAFLQILIKKLKLNKNSRLKLARNLIALRNIRPPPKFDYKFKTQRDFNLNQLPKTKHLQIIIFLNHFKLQKQTSAIAPI